MRRGSRSLVLVLGMLWLASSAGASTIPYASIWERWEAGWDAWDEWSASFGQSPVERTVRPGNSRYGRRGFVYRPDPIIFRGSYTPVGRFPGFDPYNDLSDMPVTPWPTGDPQPNWQQFARIDRLVLTGPVVGLPPGANDPVPIFFDGGSATLFRGVGIDLTRVDVSPLLISFPGVEQGPSFGERVEWRWDRFSFSPDDFYDASTAVNATSVSVSAVPVPEPGTGALLLAGLCAIAAGRRLR